MVEGEKDGSGDGNDGGLGECEATMVDAAGRMTTTVMARH